MQIMIEKSKRLLSLWDENHLLLRCKIALGREPVGHKQREGDGRTPEGCYTICLVKEQGKYGRSLGLNYPNLRDARQGLADGSIDHAAFSAFQNAHRKNVRPPWGTALGGEIYLHEGGTASDWTQGCIALDSSDMDVLFPLRAEIDRVEILP